MRILIIHNQLWAHYKSVLFEEIQRELSLSYPQSTMLVAQIALYEASRATLLDTQENTEYHYPYQVLYPRSLDSVSLWERVKGVFSTFHAFRPNVLTITGYYDWAQVLLLVYAKIRGARVIISIESSQQDRARARFKETVKKLIFKLSDGFFCFGTSSAKYLENLGVSPHKIPVRQAAVVDNARIRQRYEHAIESQNPNLKANQNFVFVGRLAPEKNLSNLLETFKMCVDGGQLQDWGLILVGDGPERELLEVFTRNNNLTERIHFTGGVGWQAVPDYLAQAEVLILPSLSEPWGLVVNEALVCGMPVIVSDKCGCALDLVINGQNGFLFDPHDRQALADAMHFYANHPQETRRHGAMSKKIIEPFSPRTVAREMVGFYHSLMS